MCLKQFKHSLRHECIVFVVVVVMVLVVVVDRAGVLRIFFYLVCVGHLGMAQALLPCSTYLGVEREAFYWLFERLSTIVCPSFVNILCAYSCVCLCEARVCETKREDETEV